MPLSIRTSLVPCLVFTLSPVTVLFSVAQETDSSSATQTTSASFSDEQLEFFEKKIRPLLIEHCHECHGPETQEASLRLDSRAAILQGGETGPAVVPGSPDTGELFAALQYDPDGYQMPPDGKLSADKIELFKQWIEMGAPWPAETAHHVATKAEFDLETRAQHWSFQPLSSIDPPQVDDAQWCVNELDAFILARLQQAGLEPSQAADKRTWIRRATLDVIGLPPTQEEVEAFLNDESDAAYANVVDRLLNSQHFGERWGRHWLDVVRYAESRGHEFDFDVANAWQYRDYVIRALNDDVPFDRFVVEHVAGDLLTQSTPFPVRIHPQTGGNESILGTGFWFLGEWVHSPVDIRQEEADRFDNMIDVYSKAFLGLTVACARCHDHKFDPIRQRDYYALQGYLQSSSYQQARFESMLTNQQLARELDQLDREISERLLDHLIAQMNTESQATVDHLLAAREYLTSTSKQQASDDIVFESFESGTYDNWTVQGQAFGAGPQTQQSIASYQGNVQAVGKFFVNSHNKRSGGQGDAETGSLTSKPFEIQKPYIHLLVGGGGHAGKTCVNLIVDGQVIHSATGANQNRMQPVSWSVQDLQGQQAVLQIVDDATEGWGNIGVDHIVFSDSPQPGAEFVAPDQDPLTRQLAQSKQLDHGRLVTWIEHLQSGESAGELTQLWADVCDPSLSLTEAVERWQRRVEKQRPQDISDTQWQSTFTADDLISTGPGYRKIHPAEQPLLTLDESGQLRASTTGSHPCVEWNPLWDRLKETPETQREPGALEGWQRASRTLRTPTFEIQGGQIWCLVRGSLHSYVAVDSHILIRGPLHGALAKTHPADDDWHWIVHDVSGYSGHHAHVEFVPHEPGGFAIQRIIQTGPLESKLEAASPGVRLASVLDKRLRERSDLTLGVVAQQIAEVLGLGGSAERFRQTGAIEFLAQHPELFGLGDPAVLDSRQAAVQDLLDRRQALIARMQVESATAPCMLDGSASNEYVFIRGAWKKRGETVARRFLEVFDGTPTHSTGSGRLDLALQMIDPQQTPILPRVAVNRIWHHYFGRGLCASPNDFGYLGERPSHPQLLDWLARRLVENQWSMKSIHREILLSATYRMSSETSQDPRVADVDPENRLLHRMNVKRLQGEAIRDSLLKLSGRLNPQMYGPSIPIHLTSFLEGRGRPSRSGPVDGEGRRSIYLSVRRNFPEPFFQAFDFPTPHSSIGRRNVSNVPAQALAMMNNPLVTEQSQGWAIRLMQELPQASFTERVDRLYQQAFARSATAQEQQLTQSFFRQQIEELQTHEDDPAVWADFCHVLLNAKEFIFIP